MIGSVVSRVGIAAAAAIVLVSAATAGDCETYARLTLQQVRQNIEKRCNFDKKQPDRWSLDIAKHRTWCKDVGPAGWRAELKVRNDMLASCQG